MDIFLPMMLEVEDAKVMADALQQFIDNNEELEQERAENGLPRSDAVVRAEAMVERINLKFAGMV